MPLLAYRRAMLLLVALVLFLTGTAVASEDFGAQRVLFLRQTGADCGTNSRTWLASAPGRTDAGCGYLGGGPFGEAFKTAGVDTAKTYTTASPLEMSLDATRNANGTITVVPYVQGPSGTGSGFGQITVDLKAVGTAVDGTVLELGAVTRTVTATPATSRQEIPFSINLADEFDTVALNDFSLAVTIRGLHGAHGFNELNGSSFVRLPFHRPAAAPTEG